ncbi:MAG: phosphomannomutase [Myxococcales bacterium]|nr:phosphomannomutase [Myxococcales bacterium]
MVTVNPAIFRKYDIRGVVDTDVTEELVAELGRAIGTMARRAGQETFALGYDARLHSPRLHDALLGGLVSCGLEVWDLGMAPTPLVYYAVFRFKLGGGVVITGSHNPPEFNGFKIMVGEGTLHGEQIQELRRMIEEGDFDAASGGAVREVDALTPYLEEVAGDMELGAWPEGRALRVVVDAGNGAAGVVAEPLLRRLGLDVVAKYIEPDGHFPNHHPDPSEPENVEALIEAVREEGADLGVAYDGDGDRIGVVDEQGQIIWGDRLMILFSRALLKEEPGATIVGEVKCSQTMYDDIRAHGGDAIMWRVGHSLIKSKMKESGALLAGEVSGHIFFKHRWYGFDDAVYATARLVELVTRMGGPVSSLLSDVPETFATPELRVETRDEVKFAIAERVAGVLEGEGHEVVTIDGVRVIYEDGWGLVRASNTQPALVLRAEAQSPERRDAIEASLRARVREAEAALMDS